MSLEGLPGPLAATGTNLAAHAANIPGPLPPVRESGAAREHPANLKERDMELEFICKWIGSGTGNCPAGYRAANGNYVIQGWQLDDATRANLRDLADNETAVEVPADVIHRLVAATGAQ